jgi:Xaa-Pro dipeptidase
MIPSERHERLLVPAGEIAARVSALQRVLVREDLALAWVDHAADRLYFAGSAQDGVVLVPRTGSAVFVARKSVARATAESALEVIPFAGRKALARLVDDLRAGGPLGMALDVTSAATYAWLQGERGAPVTDLGASIRLLRATKSAWEIEQLAEAGRQAEAIYLEAPSLIRAGMTELELSGAIEARLRARGHGGTVRVRRPGSDIAALSVVSGASALYPTGFDGCVGAEGPAPPAPPGAGWKVIAPGETVMIDMVTWWNGYHADHTRTFFVGARAGGGPGTGGGRGGATVPREAADAHRFCLEALDAIVERLRPGARTDEIYRAVRAWVDGRGEPAGFMGHGENRVKFFGHGVGLELDEFPIIADRIEVELAAGMAIAVEPKAFLPGVGPVGIENTYVVTAHGAESLCAAPLELVVVG